MVTHGDEELIHLAIYRRSDCLKVSSPKKRDSLYHLRELLKQVRGRHQHEDHTDGRDLIRKWTGEGRDRYFRFCLRKCDGYFTLE